MCGAYGLLCSSDGTDRGIYLRPDRSRENTPGCTLHPATHTRPCKAGNQCAEGLYRRYSSSRTLKTDQGSISVGRGRGIRVYVCVGVSDFEGEGKLINSFFFRKGLVLNPFFKFLIIICDFVLINIDKKIKHN